MFSKPFCFSPREEAIPSLRFIVWPRTLAIGTMGCSAVKESDANYIADQGWSTDVAVASQRYGVIHAMYS